MEESDRPRDSEDPLCLPLRARLGSKGGGATASDLEPPTETSAHIRA
jgi:hypothetical protein